VQLCQMSYKADIKRHKTLLRFGRYYRVVDSVLKGLKVSLNEIFRIHYMADILHDEERGIYQL